MKKKHLDCVHSCCNWRTGCVVTQQQKKIFFGGTDSSNRPTGCRPWNYVSSGLEGQFLASSVASPVIELSIRRSRKKERKSEQDIHRKSSLYLPGMFSQLSMEIQYRPR